MSMKHVFLMHDTKRYHDLSFKIMEIMEGYNYEIVYKTSMHAIQKHIEKYDEKTRFYAVGGDGTLNGVIQAVVHTEHEVVVLPFGTGNDFCRVLTKEKDVLKLLEQSLHCKASLVDTIQMNDHYFINTACFGLDSVIANHMRDIVQIPFMPQSKSYIVSLCQYISKYDFPVVEVYSQGQCLFHGPMTLCTVNNGQYYGGGFPITPDAKIDDGYMDIMIADQVPFRKIPYLLTLLLKKKLNTRKEAHYLRAQELTVISHHSCNIDGEEIQAGEYHFQIHPASLHMVRYKK